MTLHKIEYFCAKLQKKVDSGDIKDIIVGVILVGTTVWGVVIAPILERIKKRERARRMYGVRGAQYAPADKRAPRQPVTDIPSAAKTAHPFISGEEGVRMTSAATEAETGSVPCTDDECQQRASLLPGTGFDDLRRGIIWAEILRPKYKD